MFSVLPGMFGTGGLQELLAQYREKFPATSPAVHNLCISHAKRVAINKAENIRLAPKEAIFIKVAGKQAAKCQAQSFYIWPGLRMLGCVSQKGIKNGVLYEVVSCSDDSFSMRDGDTVREYTRKQLIDWFRLPHAQVYAAIQGTEYDDSLCLWETSHPKFTARLLYVGLSRARSAALVSIK